MRGAFKVVAGAAAVGRPARRRHPLQRLDAGDGRRAVAPPGRDRRLPVRAVDGVLERAEQLLPQALVADLDGPEPRATGEDHLGALGVAEPASCLSWPSFAFARTSTWTPSGTSRSIVPNGVQASITTSREPIVAWRRSSWMFPSQDRNSLFWRDDPRAGALDVAHRAHAHRLARPRRGDRGARLGQIRGERFEVGAHHRAGGQPRSGRSAPPSSGGLRQPPRGAARRPRRARRRRLARPSRGTLRRMAIVVGGEALVDLVPHERTSSRASGRWAVQHGAHARTARAGRPLPRLSVR